MLLNYLKILYLAALKQQEWKTKVIILVFLNHIFESVLTNLFKKELVGRVMRTIKEDKIYFLNSNSIMLYTWL